jgi:hypothetical protein
MSNPVPAHVLRQIAVIAECDDRTVAKHMSGETVRAIVAERIGRALHNHPELDVRSYGSRSIAAMPKSVA